MIKKLWVACNSIPCGYIFWSATFILYQLPCDYLMITLLKDLMFSTCRIYKDSGCSLKRTEQVIQPRKSTISHVHEYTWKLLLLEIALELRNCFSWKNLVVVKALEGTIKRYLLVKFLLKWSLLEEGYSDSSAKTLVYTILSSILKVNLIWMGWLLIKRGSSD